MKLQLKLRVSFGIALSIIRRGESHNTNAYTESCSLSEETRETVEVHDE